jgi:hypothetical protein
MQVTTLKRRGAVDLDAERGTESGNVKGEKVDGMVTVRKIQKDKREGGRERERV